MFHLIPEAYGADRTLARTALVELTPALKALLRSEAFAGTALLPVPGGPQSDL